MKIIGISKVKVTPGTVEVLQAPGWTIIERKMVSGFKHPSLVETKILFSDGRRLTLQIREFDVAEVKLLRDTLEKDRTNNRASISQNRK